MLSLSMNSHFKYRAYTTAISNWTCYVTKLTIKEYKKCKIIEIWHINLRGLLTSDSVLASSTSKIGNNFIRENVTGYKTKWHILV